MDTSYLTNQVANIIAQLHGLFDEIGVPNHERDSREAELFKALSESLHNHLRQVAAEKNDLTEECHRTVKAIKQMEASIDDVESHHDGGERRDLEITYPLMQRLQSLKQKHAAISQLHRERVEQVQTLVEAMKSYSSHLEPSFVRIALPPTSSDGSVPPTFDLSSTYVTALDKEFTRVFETYTRRIQQVRDLSEEIVRLWADLGTPQAQTDSRIVKHYKDHTEQLGLHETDLQRFMGIRQDLMKQKTDRERRLNELKTAIEGLWDRLGVEQADRKRFLNSNRGCGLRVMNEFEDELARLNELKRQNLHLFVEDVRNRIMELWDVLYLSEEEMLQFTPAFSDVYSDALLSSHEAELARLEALRDQRAPILQLIDKHRSLIQDRLELAQSSQDASRLMARGQKGERRDPTRLLREEKMRKRIAKELPKVEADLQKLLEDYEDEYGRPFCVKGKPYLDQLAASSSSGQSSSVLPPRSKTPSVPPSSNRNSRQVMTATTAPYLRPGSSVRGPPPSRTGAKTPTGTLSRRNLAGGPSTTTMTAGGPHSPSKIPARVPLGNMPHGNNSPERGMNAMAREHMNQSRGKFGGGGGGGGGSQNQPPSMAPPPMMRNYFHPPPPPVSAPIPPPTAVHYDADNDPRCTSAASSSQGSVRNIPPEDIYHERSQYASLQSSTMRTNNNHHPMGPPLTTSIRTNNTTTLQQQQEYTRHVPAPAKVVPENRQISATSSTTNTVSGSENWETYDDASDPEEPEPDASEGYYARLRAARGGGMKRDTPEIGMGRGYPGKFSPGRKMHHGLRGGVQPAGGAGGHMMETEGGRMIVVSGSDAGWVDDEAF